MRRPLDAERIRRFMRELGEEAERDVRLYFTGGATAVLQGWRAGTIDVDVKLEPETDRLFRALPRLKDKLEINIELASPDQFIPELSGWRERSAFIGREGRLSFYHYDFYAQALAKIERGHNFDLLDAKSLVSRGLIDPIELSRLFSEIGPKLIRYPAIDPARFEHNVQEFLKTIEPNDAN